MDSIRGFSSDIIFPEVISYSGGEILLSDRAVDHVINANQINVNTLRVVHILIRTNFSEVFLVRLPL